MPIGLVSDTDFQKELESHTKESHVKESVQIVEKVSRGRAEGDTNVPESLRKVIGETAVIEGRPAALSLASEFGISASSVSAYSKGATSTKSYNEPSKDIISHINASRRRAVSKASKTLNAALGSISQDKLDYADAKDLSAIAKDMSVIIRNLEPQKDSLTPSQSSAPQFIIYAPQFKKEESFEVINLTNE